MLKQILKAIGRRLLKVQWIKREVDAYKFEQQKRRDDQLFAKCMIASGSIRDVKEPKIVKGYKDSVNWGGMK